MSRTAMQRWCTLSQGGAIGGVTLLRTAPDDNVRHPEPAMSHAAPAVFLRAAELARGPWRARLNAVAMLNLSKTAREAEIDATCETADYLAFNVRYMREMYAIQPESMPGQWNRVDYRPLEGFVLAI